MSFNSEDLVFRLGAKFDIKPSELKAQLEEALSKLNTEIKIDTTKANEGINNVLKQISNLKKEIDSVSKMSLNLKGLPTTNTVSNNTSSKTSSSTISTQKELTKELTKQTKERDKINSQVDILVKKYTELDNIRRKNMLTNKVSEDTTEFDNFVKTNEYYKKRQEYFMAIKNHQLENIQLSKEELNVAKQMLAFYDKLASQELKATFGEANTGKTRIDGDRKAEQVRLYDELIRKTKLLAELEQKMNNLDKTKHRKEYNLLAVEADKATKEIEGLTNSLEEQGLKSKALESQLSVLSERLNIKSKQKGMQTFDAQTQDINKLTDNIKKAQAEFQKFILTNEKMPSHQIDRYNKKFDELITRLNKAKDYNQDVVAKSGLKGIQSALNSRFDITSAVEKELNNMKSTINKYSNENQLVIRTKFEKENLDKTINVVKTQLKSLETFKLNSKFVDTTELEKYEKELNDIVKAGQKIKFDSSNTKKLAESVKEAQKLKLQYGEVASKIRELKEIEKQGNIGYTLTEGIETYERKASSLINTLMAKKAELEAKKGTTNFIDNAELDKLIGQVDSVIQKIQTAKSGEIINRASLQQANSELKQAGAEVNNINTKIRMLNSGNRIDAGIDAFITKTKDVRNSINTARESVKKMAMAFGNIGSKDVQNLLNKIDQLEKELKQASDVTKTGFEIKGADASVNNIKNGIAEVRQEMSRLQTQGQAMSNVFSQVFNINAITSYIAQFYLIRRAIKAIYEEVAMLDSALTTLKMTMGGSEGTYLNLVDSAIALASESGTQMETVLEVVKTYANATESAQEVMNKIKPTIALSNIAGISASDAVNNIQSIMQQFKLIEQASGDVEQATYRVTDSITAISKSLKMNFGQGIQEISEGIMQSGATIEAVGMSYERYAALIAAVAEQSRLSGSQRASYL